MERRALRDELMTLLVAGQETSAINLAWTLAFLAHHPAAQRRAAEEVQQVKGAAPPPGPDRQLTPCILCLWPKRSMRPDLFFHLPLFMHATVSLLRTACACSRVLVMLVLLALTEGILSAIGTEHLKCFHCGTWQ